MVRVYWPCRLLVVPDLLLDGGFEVEDVSMCAMAEVKLLVYLSEGGCFSGFELSFAWLSVLSMFKCDVVYCAWCPGVFDPEKDPLLLFRCIIRLPPELSEELTTPFLVCLLFA